MKKLLVICGPTATGKTSLALYLARKFGGELVSADSRQVYRGMDIGTGKDLSLIKGVRVWGIDLVDPKKNFSVGQYTNIVQNIIRDIWRRNKLPILVGGTGLYIKAVVDGIPTASIPRNIGLRAVLVPKGKEDLLTTLAQIDPARAGSLNVSDRSNKRRLIRAIEVATWMLDHPLEEIKEPVAKGVPLLMIGLNASVPYLKNIISERTDKMLSEGILEEINKLLAKGVDWDDQAMNTIGYIEWKDYFGEKLKFEEVVAKWKRNEEKYAKRQVAWFERDKRINWFDVSGSGYKKEVESLVKKWYKGKTDEKS